MAKRKRNDGRDARRDAEIARLGQLGQAGGRGAGDQRRARHRDAAAAAAGVVPSAARWIVPGPVDGATSAEPVDVVADLLALDPRTRLRGRGDAELRALAAHVDELVTAGALAPSGRPLVEVVVVDPAARVALEPVLDLDALLSGGPVTDARHDRGVRIAGALLERGAAHRSGDVDLHAEVAPVGLPRHPRADEVEGLVRVAVGPLAAVPGPDPAIATTGAGWLGASPVDLFLAAGTGVLDRRAADVAGAALVGWLAAVVRSGDAPWWPVLAARVPADPAGLLDAAASRAGSDHPDVAGAALVAHIAARHPVDPA